VHPIGVSDSNFEPDHSSGVGFGVRRVCLRGGGRRNCSPHWRTIAAAGSSRMPTLPSIVDIGALGGNAPDRLCVFARLHAAAQTHKMLI
jgi:hypothetical protein